MSTASPLITRQLDWQHCQELAYRIRAEDERECCLMGALPLQALAAGAMFGWAKAVLRDDGSVLGAFGYSPEDLIWSLWGDLSFIEAFQVLRETPHWVRHMVDHSGQACLHNWVDASAEVTLRWLKQSRVFSIDPTPRDMHSPHDACLHAMIYFETRRDLA